MQCYEKIESDIGSAIIAAIPEPFFIFDEHGCYVQVIGGADRRKYHQGSHLIGKSIHEVIEKHLADAFVAEIQKAIKGNEVRTYVYQLSAGDIQGSEDLAGPEGKQWFEAHISPVAAIADQPRMVVWVAFNITELRKTLSEKESLIADLQRAASEIKTLKGILPICSHCKKIRDDNGCWNQLEVYIHRYSGADLSHSICPECRDKHYGQYLTSHKGG
ncbi:PAS domain-containing protein [Desulfopila inferna]|uniref:PAS domain-containing protein n=1 Tax=Desulfopila inferna TaxID=468528 RepID=UPI0019662304|nr:PAS domain-containing protein [Desulfopila inferna]